MKVSKRSLLFILIIFTAAISASIFFLSSTRENIPILQISFLNVGQGDGILITTPNNKRVLIDGGPDEGVVYKIPKSFWSFGCKIDVIISTHPHSDHSTGLKSVIKRCHPQLLIINDLSALNLPEEVSLNTIDLFSGDNFLIDGINFSAIWPKKDKISKTDENQNSIVLLMTYNDFNALFTGDAETCLYKDFSTHLSVLKVPHHGSYDPCLPSFLDKTTPDYSIISVGKNSFGHPNGTVLGDFTASERQVFRTDTNGEIDFTIGKSGIGVRTVGQK